MFSFCIFQKNLNIITTQNTKKNKSICSPVGFVVFLIKKVGWVSSGITNKIFMLCCETVSSLINQRKKSICFSEKNLDIDIHTTKLSTLLFLAKGKEINISTCHMRCSGVCRLRAFCWMRRHTKQFPYTYLCVCGTSENTSYTDLLSWKVCPLRLSTKL